MQKDTSSLTTELQNVINEIADSVLRQGGTERMIFVYPLAGIIGDEKHHGEVRFKNEMPETIAVFLKKFLI